MADDDWTLNRIGIEHRYILQPHLPLIKVGRATDQQLQCKGILFYFLPNFVKLLKNLTF